MRVTEALFKLFPPPSFITLPSVGVDISDTSLKYVSFAPSLSHDRRRVLKSWGDITIPDNVLQRGEIKDNKILVEVLKEFKAKTNAEYIRVSLPEERAYLFETEIKRDVPPKEIQSLLEFRLEENVPIAARDALFDYELLPIDGASRTVKVVVAAYQRETIMQYYEVCRAAGLTPVAFEVEAQAMARAVIPYKEKGTSMLIDFGKTRTGIGIISNGVLLFTSTIDIGGGQLSQAMRRVLGDQIAESELTTLKNEYGLLRRVDDTRVYETAISIVSIIKDEIAARTQYWHLRGDNIEKRPIKRAVLCGGSCNLRGFPEYLTESIGIPCERGDVWVNAFRTELTVPPFEKRFSFGYATAIGLALKNTV